MTRYMKLDKQEPSNWLSSTEIKKILRITGGELMHRRVKGELKFKKVGNAYFYLLPKSHA
ncbi:hypothetical protein BTO11_05295 [Psychrosphaera saromensis]|uniref:DNA-binding protein n=1 Tax=Psychrosphaera saromensis TaxID=716813 RepID=A0A2S7UT28_9GAMM|nr:hypothetical protein BTO11_05295 [Psychrosphaera saromensis]